MTKRLTKLDVIDRLRLDDSDNSHKYIFSTGNISSDVTVTLPALTGNDVFVFTDETQTLTNKTLGTGSTWAGNTITVPRGGTGQTTLTTGNVLVGNGSNPVLTSKPAPAGAFVGTTDTQTITNKSLDDLTTSIIDNSDATIRIQFDAAGTTGTATTLQSSQTANQTITFPDVTDQLVARTTTDVLTNKTITDSSNNVAADSLKTVSGVVTVNGSAAPSAGQVLTATGPAAGEWQTLPQLTTTKGDLITNNGSIETRLGVGTDDQFLVANSAQPTGLQWRTIQSTVTIPHTWAIQGFINVAAGQTDFINPFFVPVVSGQTVSIDQARYVINNGTSATVKIQVNDVDAAGFTGITVTTTASTTNPSNVVLSNNDKINLVVTAISGAPENLSFTLYLIYTSNIVIS